MANIGLSAKKLLNFFAQKDNTLVIDIYCYIPNKGILIYGWKDDSKFKFNNIYLESPQFTIDFLPTILEFDRPDVRNALHLESARGFVTIIPCQQKDIYDSGKIWVKDNSNKRTNIDIADKIGSISEQDGAVQSLIRRYETKANNAKIEKSETDKSKNTKNISTSIMNKKVLKPIDQLSCFVRIGIDYVVKVLPDTILVKGWLLDEKHYVQHIILDCNGTISRIKPTAICSHKRHDIIEAFKDSIFDTNYESGFIASFEIANFDSNTVTIYLETIKQETVAVETKQLTIKNNELERLKTILSWINPIDPKLEMLFEIYEPTLEKIWQVKKERQLDEKLMVYGTISQDPLASLIIPLYGRHDFMEYQISMFANDRDILNTELIYVIDDPRFLSFIYIFAAQLYKMYEVPFKLVYAGQNLGYAGANNFGAKYATSENILLLNSDVMPKHKGWLSKMVEMLNKLPDVGVLSPLLVYENEAIQYAGMKFDKHPFIDFIWVNYHPNKGSACVEMDFEYTEVEAATGACLLMKRKVYEQIGGFTEDYIIGDFEDSDLCLKLHELGYKLYFTPKVSLYHLERQSQNLFDTIDWKNNLTLFNGYLASKKWDSTIKKIKQA